jgi:penicillin amidase
VSANARPPGTLAERIGALYAGPDRAIRLRKRLDARPLITRSDLARCQTDIVSDRARALAHRFAALVPTPPPRALRHAREALATWDGVYARTSRGAVAYEAFLAAFLDALSDRGIRRTVHAAADVHGLVERELQQRSAAACRRAAGRAARAADRALRRYPSWEAMHRLRLAHPFGRLPGARRRLRFLERGTAGGRDTLMKTAHPPTSRRHVVRKGAIARFITDLGDVDGSTFVLLGGQDGWPGSPTFLDQHDAWEAGRQLPLPLSADGVRRGHPHVHSLVPEEWKNS